MMVFCKYLEINAETKKLEGVKVVPFWVLYSWLTFDSLKKLILYTPFLKYHHVFVSPEAKIQRFLF